MSDHTLTNQFGKGADPGAHQLLTKTTVPRSYTVS